MGKEELEIQPLHDILNKMSEFPLPTYEEWKKVTEKSLKGGSFETLLTKTYEGITLKPMYQQSDVDDIPFAESLPGFVPYVRGTKAVQSVPAPWVISQEIALPTPEQWNEAVQHDLARGQTGLNITLDEATKQGLDVDEADASAVGKNGVSLSSVTDLQQACRDVDVQAYPILVQTGAVSLPFFAAFIAFLREEKMDETKLTGCIGADPLAALAKNGELPYALATCFDVLAEVTSWTRKHAPKLDTVLVDSRPYHNGGGSAVEELAFTLAAAVEYIRNLVDRGLTIDEVAGNLQFSFSIGSNLFMEIAKFRAARMLWAKIVAAFGGNEEVQKMKIHARTSEWNKTVYDPHVNMLRGTIEAFAGAVGGVDSMHVAPFDDVVQTANEFSRRIARNTQIILQEESHLGKVTDPAGGSWYVEALTNEIAEKTWKLFQETEAKGGLEKALREGFPQEKIATTAKKREENIKKRLDTIVGTNRYANPLEKRLEIGDQANNVYEQRASALDKQRSQFAAEMPAFQSDSFVEEAITAAREGATIGMLAKAVGRGEVSESVAAIPQTRAAVPFEKLRDNMERYVEQSGKRPQVFLANVGAIAGYKARADFASGFFEVGGFEVLTNNGFASVEEAANAALESGAEAVVISAKDAVYPTAVPELAKRLQTANPELTIYLAGNPPQEELKRYKQAGIEDVVNVKSNVYDTIARLQKLKGVMGT